MTKQTLFDGRYRRELALGRGGMDGFLLLTGLSGALEGRTEIWSLAIKDGTLRREVGVLGSAFGGVVSPDARTLAYVSDETGGQQVYVRPFHREGPALRVSPQGGANPRWSRDGRALYYVMPDGWINRVAITPGDPLGLGEPTRVARPPVRDPRLFSVTWQGASMGTLFELTDTPDRFLTLMGQDQPSAATLVLDWQSLLVVHPKAGPLDDERRQGDSAMTATLDRLTAALEDRYRVDRELGQGGMATVYLAHDVRHHRKVALKVLRPELAAVIGAERFLAEIRTTANLQHPHILPLFDSGTVDGTVFYVMPFVDGESLRDRLTRERQLPIEDAVRITREAADALHHAHGHGVIHRDIKPENILLQGGHALVADFGIALAVSSAGGSRLTETGMSLGTPHYMSPEQARGERTLDGRTDVYALGAVLYELLTGEPPFTGATAQAILAKAMTERPVPPRVVRDTVPGGVERATLKALAKLPADRFVTAAAFADALTRSDDRPASAAAPRIARIVGATAVLAFAAGAGLHWTMTRTQRGDEVGSSTGWRRYSIVLPDSAPLTAGYSRIQLPGRGLAVSPDGGSMVYVATGPGGARLRLVRLEDGESEDLSGTANPAFPTWSPDGRQVAFSAERSIRALDLSRRTISTVTPLNFETAGLYWHPDGNLYFIEELAEKKCLYSVSASGGEPRIVGGDANPIRRCEGLGNHVMGSEWIGIYSTRRVGVVAAGANAGRLIDVVDGSNPIFLSDRELAFVRDDVAFAVRFDPANPRPIGSPRALFSGVRREPAFGQAHWSLAGDGTLVWVAGATGAVGRLVRADRSGNVLDTLPIDPVVVGGIALSPDGRRLAVQPFRESGRSNLQIVDLTTHATDEVTGTEGLTPHGWTNGGSAVLLAPSHSPDAQAVARVEGGTWVTDSSDAGYWNSSPDGTWRCGFRSNKLAFWRRATPAEPVSVEGERNAAECTFSRDGRWMAWLNFAGGVCLIPTDARSAEARIKLAPAGFIEPRWMPDNREIYLRLHDAWYVVRIPARVGEQPSPPRKVFDGNAAHFLQAANWSYDIDPEGRLLLIQGGPPTRANRLEVMTNFPAFVRAKLAQVPNP